MTTALMSKRIRREQKRRTPKRPPDPPNNNLAHYVGSDLLVLQVEDVAGDAVDNVIGFFVLDQRTTLGLAGLQIDRHQPGALVLAVFDLRQDVYILSRRLGR